MSINIYDLLEKRKQYPILGIKHSQADYINNCFSSNSEQVALILPESFLYSVREHELREQVFNEWKLTALLDLGGVWKPLTCLKFVLLIVQKKTPDFVLFSEYKSKDTFEGDVSSTRAGVVGVQKITASYRDYIDDLEGLVNEQVFIDKNTSTYKVWKLEYSKIDLNNLSLNFYNPNSQDVLDLINQEDTKTLKELASILRSRKLQQDTHGLVIKTKDFKYPLDLDSLVQETQTTIRLQKGDILFSGSFAGNKKFYLVTDSYSSPIFASSFLTVIRPDQQIIKPEYLFLYLQSETAQKYIQLFQRGTFFPQIDSKNLKNLPVIIPDKLTQNKSVRIFKTLFLGKKEDLVQAINRELFDTKISYKPFQRELIFEELDQLRMFKRDVIERIIQSDLNELNTCIEKKLYKSFLILSGSILEAFLLDWISEIEKKDYFSPKSENFTLGKLIWKLRKVHYQIFDEDLLSKADKIRKKRNFVHPKEYFNTHEKLDDTMCTEVIEDLKNIFNRRM